MDIKPLLLRENDRIHGYLDRICSDLTDEQVRYEHDAVDERGIGNIVSHLYGSLVNRASIAAGQPQPATVDPPQTSAALMSLINDAHQQVAQLLSGVTEEQLAQTVAIRDRQVVALEALMTSFSHASRHVGNILDARHLGGFETHALG